MGRKKPGEETHSGAAVSGIEHIPRFTKASRAQNSDVVSFAVDFHPQVPEAGDGGKKVGGGRGIADTSLSHSYAVQQHSAMRDGLIAGDDDIALKGMASPNPLFHILATTSGVSPEHG